MKTVAGLIVLALCSSRPALSATTWTVSSTGDDAADPTTLRGAIASSSSGDTIQITATGTITLTGGTLTIDKNLTINGPGPANLAINGNFTFGNSTVVFNVVSGTTAISGMTLENGSSEQGGGIRNAGTLMLNNISLSQNGGFIGGAIYNGGTLTVVNGTVSGNGSAIGGGIFNNGTLTLTNSTVSGNSSQAGGGIANSGTLTLTNSTVSGNGSGSGGGILNSGTLTVTNSTISANSVYNGGGGVFNGGIGTMTLTNSTISGNSSPVSGGGIFNAGTLTAKNSIVANSPVGGDCYIDPLSTTASLGHNLADDATCSFVGTGDLNSTLAGLDPSGLQNNGGPTNTIALLAGSPAINAVLTSPINYCTAAGGTTAIATDQRGFMRPAGTACDIGAFEFGAIPPSQYVAFVQQPINPNGSSVFSVQRGVVPLKFTLSLGGVATCQLPPATISLIRSAGSVLGSIDESTYLLASDSGPNFRIDTTNCQYVYNVATGSLGPGTYVVSISVGASVVGSGTFGLH
jgi:hypothetical protein